MVLRDTTRRPEPPPRHRGPSYGSLEPPLSRWFRVGRTMRHVVVVAAISACTRNPAHVPPLDPPELPGGTSPSDPAGMTEITCDPELEVDATGLTVKDMPLNPLGRHLA